MKNFKYFIIIFSFVVKHAMSQCDSSFSSFEFIPGNVNILSGDSCFYNQDLEVSTSTLENFEIDKTSQN